MIVRELVTLLRYQLDKSGLAEYAQKARSVGQQVSGVGRAAMQGWREGVNQALTSYGLVPGKVIQGIREQRRLNAEAAKLPAQVKRAEGGYTALAGSIRNIFGAYLGFQGARSFLLAGDEFGQISSRLKNATSSAEEYLMVDKALQANSEESFKPFATNAELFIRTNDVLKAMGKTTQDTLDVVSAANLSLAASGADAQKAASFVDQFGKAMGMGKLTGDAFQSMLANNQTMIKYLVAGLQETAPALGATEANLQQLVTQGKITTDRMIPALRTQLGKMRKDVEDMPVAIGDAMTVLRDNVARLSWNLNVNYGTIKAVTKSLEFMAQNLGKILHLLFLLGASFALTRLQAGMRALAASAGGLRMFLTGSVASMARSLWPLARMMAMFETIRLIGDDVLTWLRGGRSVLGGIIGRSEEWREQIDWVKDRLKSIKDLLGGAGESTESFLKKWGTVGILVLGVDAILGGSLRKSLAWIVFTALPAFAKELNLIATTPAGRMLALWAAIVLGLKWVYDNADKIADKLRNAFGGALGDIEKKVESLAEKLKGLMPEGMKDYLKENLGGNFNEGLSAQIAGKIDASKMQRSGGSSGAVQDNRQTEINIHGVPGNPAAVGRAAEDGVRRGYGASGAWAPAYSAPNVEALP